MASLFLPLLAYQGTVGSPMCKNMLQSIIAFGRKGGKPPCVYPKIYMEFF
jgi:hypothetical protein